MRRDEWIEINGFDGIYLVNIFGQVKSKDRYIDNWPKGKRLIKGKILNGFLSGNGYYMVELRKPGAKRKVFYKHRLIAEYFIPNTKEKPHVNHKDGVKTNNSIQNLEWCTHKENMRHAHGAGLIAYVGNGSGEDSPNSKLNNNQVLEIRSLSKKGFTDKQIAKKFCVCSSTIGSIRRRDTWRHLEAA